MRIDVRGTPKRDENQPEAVERRHQRRHEAEHGQDLTEGSGRPRRNKQMVLAEETRRQGESCERERTHHERPIGNRQFVFQPPHTPHILFVMQGDDHGPATEKQEGLEGTVGQEMIHAGGIGAETAGHDHVAELANCRVGDDTFDIGLCQGDGRPHDHRHSTGNCHERHGGRRQVIEWSQPRNHEDASRDHRRGMNECRDGGGTFHRIRQPDVERHLGRLADCACK